VGRVAIAVWIAVAGALTAVLASRGIMMPLTGISCGSPAWDSTLRDVYIDALPSFRHSSRVLDRRDVRRIASGGFLGWRALEAFRARLMQPWIVVFCASILVVYGLLFAIGELYDRYLIFVVPALAILLIRVGPRALLGDAAHRAGRREKTARSANDGSAPGAGPQQGDPSRAAIAASILTILVSATFAVAGTHDYLAWNRARWRALQDLVAVKSVPPAAIDGGFEFNGFYLYDPGYRPPPDKSWWWVHDDEYMIAFGPMDGWAEISRWPWTSWIFPGERAILTLRRSGRAGRGAG
jgi:hypothetical protein